MSLPRASYVITGYNSSNSVAFVFPSTPPAQLDSVRELVRGSGARYVELGQQDGGSVVEVGLYPNVNPHKVIGFFKDLFKPKLPFSMVLLRLEIQRCKTGRHNRAFAGSPGFLPGFEPKDMNAFKQSVQLSRIDIAALLPFGASQEEAGPYIIAVKGAFEQAGAYLRELELHMEYCCG